MWFSSFLLVWSSVALVEILFPWYFQTKAESNKNRKSVRLDPCSFSREPWSMAEIVGGHGGGVKLDPRWQQAKLKALALPLFE